MSIFSLARVLEKVPGIMKRTCCFQFILVAPYLIMPRSWKLKRSSIQPLMCSKYFSRWATAANLCSPSQCFLPDRLKWSFLSFAAVPRRINVTGYNKICTESSSKHNFSITIENRVLILETVSESRLHIIWEQFLHNNFQDALQDRKTVSFFPFSFKRKISGRENQIVLLVHSKMFANEATWIFH